MARQLRRSRHRTTLFVAVGLGFVGFKLLQRRRQANRSRRNRELNRNPGHWHLSRSGVFDLDKHVAMQDLRRLKNSIDRLHRRTRNLGIVEQLEPDRIAASEKYFRKD